MQLLPKDLTVHQSVIVKGIDSPKPSLLESMQITTDTLRYIKYVQP